jgi:hypothetical protein
LVKCTDLPKTEGEDSHPTNWSKIASIDDWSSVPSLSERKEKNEKKRGNGLKEKGKRFEDV